MLDDRPFIYTLSDRLSRCVESKPLAIYRSHDLLAAFFVHGDSAGPGRGNSVEKSPMAKYPECDHAKPLGVELLFCQTGFCGTTGKIEPALDRGILSDLLSRRTRADL